MAQQLNELTELKLKKDEDPKRFGQRLIRVVNSYRNTIDETQLVAVVVREGGRIMQTASGRSPSTSREWRLEMQLQRN